MPVEVGSNGLALGERISTYPTINQREVNKASTGVFPEAVARSPYQGVETLTRTFVMSTFTPILLLSLLTISVSAGFRFISHDSTAQLPPSISRQLVAAMTTDHEGNPPIPHGGKPKRFFQSQDNLNS